MASPLSPGSDRKRKESPASSKRSRRSGSSITPRRLPASEPPRVNPRDILSSLHTPGRDPAADVALADATTDHFARYLGQHVAAMADVTSAREAFNDALRVRHVYICSFVLHHTRAALTLPAVSSHYSLCSALFSLTAFPAKLFSPNFQIPSLIKALPSHPSLLVPSPAHPRTHVSDTHV